MGLANGKITGRRDRLARVFAKIGVTRLLEAMPQHPVLIVLNYHRIGDGAQSEFDSGVYSATVDEFEAQISYLHRRYHIASLPEVLDMLEGKIPKRPSILITFDDGYIDNYLYAFPILRKYGVQGVFFLPTAFIGTGRLPWWDVVAYMLKKTRKKSIRVTYPEIAEFDLESHGLAIASMRLASFYRRPITRDFDKVYAELENVCEVRRPQDVSEPRFLNWGQAREMLQAGMAFGSHTHEHPMLSSLTPREQQEEIRISRKIIEEQLGIKIDTFAYPYGVKHAFSDESVHEIRQLGYRAAFSFYGGINRLSDIQPYDIRRCDVGDSYSMLRLRTALGLVSCSSWF